MATHALLLLPPLSSLGSSMTRSSRPGFSSYQLRQCATTKLRGDLSILHVGSLCNHGRIHRTTCHGWQTGEKSCNGNRKQKSKLICAAIPTAVAAAGSALFVAGAIFALMRLNKDTILVLQAKEECTVCGGSGLCPSCNGEGFMNKNLSPEAAARARARAKDAATRYTAGLAKKWNYCKTCAGQRGCQSCAGRGWVQ